MPSRSSAFTTSAAPPKPSPTLEPTVYSVKSYSLNVDTVYTVVHTDANGEQHDLNADGEPCFTTADLAAFIGELHVQGAYDAATRDALLIEAEGL